MSSIYPDLHNIKATAPSIIEDDGLSYRLHKISEMENFLRNEIDQRNKLNKKFKRYKTIITTAENSFKISSALLEIGAITVLSTGVGLPISIALGSVWNCFYIFYSITSKFIQYFNKKSHKT